MRSSSSSLPLAIGIGSLLVVLLLWVPPLARAANEIPCTMVQKDREDRHCCEGRVNGILVHLGCCKEGVTPKCTFTSTGGGENPICTFTTDCGGSSGSGEDDCDDSLVPCDDPVLG